MTSGLQRQGHVHFVGFLLKKKKTENFCPDRDQCPASSPYSQKKPRSERFRLAKDTPRTQVLKEHRVVPVAGRATPHQH